MKKQFLVFLKVIALASLLTSCSSYYDRGEFPFCRGIGKTCYEIKALFLKTDYPKIINSDVLKVEADSGYKNGAEFRRVTYRYGLKTCENIYYVDKEGDIVKCRKGKTKHNGYPYADSVFYTINSDGDVVFDYLFATVLFLFILLLYRVFST